VSSAYGCTLVPSLNDRTLPLIATPSIEFIKWPVLQMFSVGLQLPYKCSLVISECTQTGFFETYQVCSSEIVVCPSPIYAYTSQFRSHQYTSVSSNSKTTKTRYSMSTPCCTRLLVPSSIHQEDPEKCLSD